VNNAFPHFVEIKLEAKGTETFLHSKSQPHEIMKLLPIEDMVLPAYVGKTVSLLTHSSVYYTHG